MRPAYHKAQWNKIIKKKTSLDSNKDRVREKDLSEIGEIKRMFVRPEFRGKNIAFNLLKELEIWASELNFKVCILETGIRQIEALALYKKANYEITENYGQYKNIENSICLKKLI